MADPFNRDQTQSTGTGLPIITPDPYNTEEITKALDASRAAIAEQFELQQQQWTQMESILNTQAQESREAIVAYNEEITAALATALPTPERITVDRTQLDRPEAIDIQSVVAPMQNALQQQITGMRTAYTAQVAVQAKQLDAAVGAGAFGGNSYRAQQAYQSSMNQLMGQTLGQIATTTIQAEQAILGATSQLAGLQAQISAEFARAQGDIASREAGLEAQLNAEQTIRFRELQANREVQLMQLLGQSAEMTVEAGSVLTNNWLNYFSMSNQSATQLIEIMSRIDITEAGIRQQQARDIFGAEMQAITNNANLQIAYRNAAAQEYAARQRRRAQDRATNASMYVAELQRDTNIQIANIGAEAQRDVALIETEGLLREQQQDQAFGLDVLRMLG
jgi:hypothetical protein